jgi:hypothetical protein
MRPRRRPTARTPAGPSPGDEQRQRRRRSWLRRRWAMLRKLGSTHRTPLPSRESGVGRRRGAAGPGALRDQREIGRNWPTPNPTVSPIMWIMVTRRPPGRTGPPAFVADGIWRCLDPTHCSRRSAAGALPHDRRDGLVRRMRVGVARARMVPATSLLPREHAHDARCMRLLGHGARALLDALGR